MNDGYLLSEQSLSVKIIKQFVKEIIINRVWIQEIFALSDYFLIIYLLDN